MVFNAASGSEGHIHIERQCPLCPVLSVFAPALDPFGEGTEMRCVLHACVPYVFNGALARREKTVLGKPAIKIRVRHDIPHLIQPGGRWYPELLCHPEHDP
jgi:hypothetical protein